MNLNNFKIKQISLIKLLLLLTFFKGVIFSMVVPIWHTPDEQAHFAQVAFFSEFKKMPVTGNDLNKEIHASEILLGTDRDNSGNNKFTFRPEYRIEYTEALVGKYENQINSLPIDYRTTLVKQEAAYYPPLYYWLGSGFYNFFDRSGIIDRIFSVRLLSILLSILTVFVVYLIAKRLFPKDNLLQISLPILVSFQPMFSFITSGVNSDNLMNLLFTSVIYSTILLIIHGPTRKVVLLNLVIVFLLFLTKPQFVLSFPIIVVAGLMHFLINKKVRSSLKVFMVLIPILGFLLLIYALENSLLDKLIMRIPFLYSYYPHHEVGNDLSFVTFFKQSLIHTYKEVIPWYWGVFDWLGVVLPRDVNRVINRIMVLVGIGALIKLYKVFKKRTQEDYIFILLISCS
jgi:hypothetical protein